MIELDISKYSGNYAHLNSKKNLPVNSLDLSRALVTVGKEGWVDTITQGYYRIVELFAKGQAYTSSDNGKLVLNDKYFDLTQSEKATISYYYGQALTKLYSEHFFNIKWLYHLDNHLDIITFHRKGTAPAKHKIANTNNRAEKPDLVGIVNKSETHIFESKATSWSFSDQKKQHAINQVSQVQQYNKRTPNTRSACFFELSNKPIKGTIIDPEGDNYGIDIEINETTILDRYYDFFRTNRSFFFFTQSFVDYEFLTVPIGDSILFGFDKRILDLESEELLELNFYNPGFLEEINQYENLNISLGLDGIIVIEKTNSKFFVNLVLEAIK